MTHTVVPVRTYVMVFLALLCGTALTVAVTFFNLGEFNLLIALAIAFTKAGLVVFFFMNVRYSSALTKVFVFSGLLFFIILIVMTYSDFVSRMWLPESGAWHDPLAGRGR